MKRLTIIGAGKVGCVLGRQFVRHQVFQLAQVCNRSLASAQQAWQFIAADTGTAADTNGVAAVADFADLQAADVTMLTVPDDQIAATCTALLARGVLRPGSIVFHCSGAKASTELAAASALGVLVASLHPVRSFADVAKVAASFAGTICSLEGDAAALQVLAPALQASGATVVQISAANKLLYHAGSVFASNYLVTLMETAMQAYQAAGIPPALATAMAEPLARQTLDNVFQMGTVSALTGPIARGDMHTVKAQQQQVADWNADAGALYAAFMPATAALAQLKNGA
ncbi:Rossmann-like and DUF2520 domain-containing protein [soil metagenome]